MPEPHAIPPLLRLPPELLLQTLALLPPYTLSSVAQTCTALHQLSHDDRIWQPLVNSNLSTPITSPSPLSNFRDLYVAHHPHWFLPHHQLWFTDNIPGGKLVVSRFDSTSGCIMGYAVLAMRGVPSLHRWEKDPRVIIHSFDPHVSLDLQRPVIRLSADSTRTDDQPNHNPSDRDYGPPSKYSKETLMDVSADSGLYSSLMLCRPLPESATFEGTGVWPPREFPAVARVRNESSDGYESTGHRPTTLSEVSTHHFRLRKWVEYSGRRSSPQRIHSFNPVAALGLAGSYFSATLRRDDNGRLNIRVPQDISTYATLSPECYTPTPEKPWQGIWCGDYSGHGCEFILVMQPDKEDERPLPEGMSWLQQWFRGQQQSSAQNGDGYDTDDELTEDPAPSSPPASRSAGPDGKFEVENSSPRVAEPASPTVTDPHNVPSGRLEAIKLTGDPNIPRGEYTFIAPDIGNEGFLRIADEELFRGARIVKSAGHIAERGFVNDEYMPSQLIMISHDTLAQFWESFGHMSYFRRVDLEALVRYTREAED